MSWEGAAEPMELTEVCAFTGHRPIKFDFGYNEQDIRCQALIDTLASKIEMLQRRGITKFISGMALGVDTWAAEIVLKLKQRQPELQLYCAVPCKGQEAMWTAAAKRRYKNILKQADRVIVLADKFTPGCMEERDKWMVDRAGTILAVLRKGLMHSGTGLTVSYAKLCQREVIIIDPDALPIR